MNLNYFSFAIILLLNNSILISCLEEINYLNGCTNLYVSYKSQALQPFWINDRIQEKYSFEACKIKNMDKHSLWKENDENIPEVKEMIFKRNLINKLHSIQFNKLIELKKLTISGTSIKIIPKDLLKYNIKLEYLDLMNNKIHSIKCSIEHLKHLSFIDLSSNYLTVLEKIFFNAMLYRKINEVYINGNDLRCDCNMLWFLGKGSFLANMHVSSDEHCNDKLVKCLYRKYDRINSHTECQSNDITDTYNVILFNLQKCLDITLENHTIHQPPTTEKTTMKPTTTVTTTIKTTTTTTTPKKTTKPTTPDKRNDNDAKNDTIRLLETNVKYSDLKNVGILIFLLVAIAIAILASILASIKNTNNELIEEVDVQRNISNMLGHGLYNNVLPTTSNIIVSPSIINNAKVSPRIMNRTAISPSFINPTRSSATVSRGVPSRILN